jgi:hypothetical protein
VHTDISPTSRFMNAKKAKSAVTTQTGEQGIGYSQIVATYETNLRPTRTTNTVTWGELPDSQFSREEIMTCADVSVNADSLIFHTQRPVYACNW